MGKIELTFPVFYHCAVKNACNIQQYNCVNILLCGKPYANDGTGLTDTSVSNYVNGAKPLPKDIVADLLHLPTDELIRRFAALNYFDESVIVEVLVRLLDNVSISPLAKNELLLFANNPETKFNFISKVFLAAIKNPTKVSRLTKAEKTIIKCCRENIPVPDDEEQVSIADRRYSHAKPPSPPSQAIPSEEIDAILKILSRRDSFPNSPCLDLAQNLLTVLKWTPSQEDIPQTIDYFKGLFQSRSESVSTVLRIDHADIMGVIERGTPHSSLVVLECSGAYQEVLRYLNTSSCFDDALAALIIVDAYNETTTFGQVYDAVKAVEDRLSPDAHCVLGTRSIHSDEDHFTVRILYQSVSSVS